MVLGELTLELHYVYLEIIWGKLCTAFSAGVTRGLEYVDGRPQIETRIDCVPTF